MEHKQYHHGNLEEALIENGIAILDSDGMEGLSLRKVAMKSGVSHAAPYKHFADKEELIGAMRRHVETQFADHLTEALRAHEGSPDQLMQLARAYLDFFLQKPHYLRFLQYRSGMQVDFTDQSAVSDYRPFEVFKQSALMHMAKWGVPEGERMPMLLGMWATVQGVTSLAVMEGVRYDGDWGDFLEYLLHWGHTKGESYETLCP